MKDRWYAELTLIGIALNSDKRSLVFESVREEDFGSPQTQNFYRRLLKHWKEHGSTDFKAVTNLLDEDEKKIYLLADDAFYPSIDVEAQVKEFNNDITVERVKDRASQLMSANDIDDVNKIGSEIQQLLRGAVRTKPLTFWELTEQFAAEMSEEIQYIPTGYQKLDEYALIDRGDFIVLAGEQSAGKTALSISLMLNMAKHGHKCVYFSLETSSMGIFQRAASMSTGISFSKILRRKLDKNDEETFVSKWDELKELPITVVESAGWTVDKIRAEALRLDADIIFIDYIGLINASGKSRYEQITNISIELHQMAQSNKITTICLSQQNRGADNTMHSLRDSGQLESDADMVLILKRKDIDNSKENWETMLTIAKNKKGRVGMIPMWFEGSIQRFTQMTSFEY